MSARSTRTPYYIYVGGQGIIYVLGDKNGDGGVQVCIGANASDAAFIVQACNGWDNPAALRARLAELEGAKSAPSVRNKAGAA